MTLELDPDLIVEEGASIRRRLRHAPTEPLEYGYQPGNMTLYELLFVPAETFGYTPPGRTGSSGIHRKANRDLMIAKCNGTPSLTWCTWLPLLEPAGGFYIDPGYLNGIINCTLGDVYALGLLLNAVAGVPRQQLDASPYITEDRKLGRWTTE